MTLPLFRPSFRRPGGLATIIAALALTVAAPPATVAQKPRILGSAPKVEEAPPTLRRPWIKVQTRNFTLFGDASERQMQTVATSLESLRAFLDQMSQDRVQAPVPTIIYVFRNRRSFEDYEPRDFSGEPRGFTGYFHGASHANYIAIDGSRRKELGRVAQHEYTHFFASYRLPPIPLWFNEGLAQFYESFEAKKDHVNIGKILPHHLAWFEDRPLMPLLDLLAVKPHSPEYNEASHLTRFYAQSWALVHYLFLEAEDGRAQLARFLELERRLPLAEAFGQAFGRSPTALEEELRAYVRSRRFTYRRSDLPPSVVDLKIAAQPLSEAEALARLGELLAVQGVFRYKSANAHFRRALELNPSEIRAHVGLGLAEMAAGSWGDAEAAVGHFKEAKRLSPTDLPSIFLHASARARRGDPRPPLRAEAAALVEIHPKHRGAMQLLAWTWAEEAQKVDEAVAVFERAHRLMPENRVYADHLHRLYTAVGKTDAAAGLVASYFGPWGLEPSESPVRIPRP
ncbi:MAG: DUF1570 domain-containing protein [Acidobacteriota bacterium]